MIRNCYHWTVPEHARRSFEVLHSPLGRQIFDVTIAQYEPKIEPHCMPNELDRKAMANVGDGLHPPI
jgi:hypothetical protein